MTQLEKLTRGATIKGIFSNENVTAIYVKWDGNDVVELTYKDAKGQPYTELIFREREPTLEIIRVNRCQCTRTLQANAPEIFAIKN